MSIWRQPSVSTEERSSLLTPVLTGVSRLAGGRGSGFLHLLHEDHLVAGRLGGLGMDVGQAPDQRPSPTLAAHPRAVATPHLGGLTPANADAQAASAVRAAAAAMRRISIGATDMAKLSTLAGMYYTFVQVSYQIINQVASSVFFVRTKVKFQRLYLRAVGAR